MESVLIPPPRSYRPQAVHGPAAAKSGSTTSSSDVLIIGLPERC
jgi:hypothetical protein